MKLVLKHILFFIFIPTLLWAQHTIKGTFTPAEDYNVVLLYKVSPTVSEYISNAKIDEEGSFEIILDSTATKGMYRLVYAIPQEDYNFDIIYNGAEDINLSFNSETGVKFHSSIENSLLASYTNSMSMVTHSIGKFFSENSTDTLALKKIFETQKNTQQNYEEAAKDLMVLEFIKANKPFIPKSFVDVKTYVNSLKAHYFDTIDFTNKTLQSSNFLEEKMLNYVFGMTIDSDDEIVNYKSNIDVVCKAMEPASKQVKRILLVSLWQQMADLNFESVANYISEKYLMDLAVALNDQELLNVLIKYQNVSIGKIAPDFSFKLEEGGKTISKKLSDLKGFDKYIIVFWNTTCSHCLEEIPELHALTKTQNNLKVIAIALEEEPNDWKELIKNYPGFIHVYGLGKWNNPIGNDYGVTATPTYFILNKDKKIIIKPVDFEALKVIFDEK
ncbi:TlpA family protein disulfide reductase [Seonamhaeicola sediminis]|uniref:TlpA family protein disulfide reductase n=1 Tax=Seonamhaeicola sediminis TaxID=2528206 RepID=A0A562YH76_9FLAO|nr:TlpA disulfide reductase family protein [Seonamhaeicola sediminis]TWO33884.1 TlpA family protein disulfide reductase [Seonamhaeicola sediminis]